MKINFCDLCNESVPQADLDEGRAFVRKGRVICASCERAMSHAEPSDFAPAIVIVPETPSFAAAEPSGVPSAVPTGGPEPAQLATTEDAFAGFVGGVPVLAPAHAAPLPLPAGEKRARSSGALWLALLALGVTVGSIFVLDERLRRGAVRTGAVANRVGELQEANSALTSSLDETRKGARALATRLEASLGALHQSATRSDAALEALQREVAVRKSELDDARDELAALRETAKGGGLDLEKRLADLSLRLAKSEDERNALAQRVAAVESGVLVPSVPAPAAAEPVPEAPWKAYVADLKSPNDGTRIEAVYALGKSLDPEVVGHLVPMLRDTNVFVRMASARVLGEMRGKAKPALGPLIDALEDEQSAVREAAHVALRAISEKDLKFDPVANEAERARRVKAWREWLAKEGGGQQTALGN